MLLLGRLSTLKVPRQKILHLETRFSVSSRLYYISALEAAYMQLSSQKGSILNTLQFFEIKVK